MIIAVLNDINMLGADVQVYRTSKSYIEPLIFQLHNSPVDCARELSKSSRLGESSSLQ